MAIEYWEDEAIVKRFFSKVDKKAEDECWEWTAGKDKDNYGYFKINRSNKRAHRVSFEINHNRFIVDKLLILHSCDNPCCVNPSHLSEGTHKDNVADMFVKGRQRERKGTASGTSKLTDDKVIEIRAKHATGDYTHRRIANEYNMSRQQISRIINKERWAHI